MMSLKELIEKYNIKKWLLFLGILLFFLTFELIFFLFGVDLVNINFNDYLKIELFKDLFFFILLGLMYRKYLKEKWLDFWKNIKTYFPISFKDWLSGFIVMLIANIIISNFISGAGENEAAVQDLISKAPFIALLMTTFFAPFIEEMIFRKILKDAVPYPIIFMIVSGFIFGLVHVIGASNIYEYLLIISYGAPGFFFAKTLNKTDNIFCTIMMHMMHNGILTILAMVI